MTIPIFLFGSAFLLERMAQYTFIKIILFEFYAIKVSSSKEIKERTT